MYLNEMTQPATLNEIQKDAYILQLQNTVMFWQGLAAKHAGFPSREAMVENERQRFAAEIPAFGKEPVFATMFECEYIGGNAKPAADIMDPVVEEPIEPRSNILQFVPRSAR